MTNAVLRDHVGWRCCQIAIQQEFYCLVSDVLRHDFKASCASIVQALDESSQDVRIVLIILGLQGTEHIHWHC